MRSVLWISTLVLVACGGHANGPTDGSTAADTSSRAPAMHRAKAVACPPLLIDPKAPCFSVDGGTGGTCAKNSDCTSPFNPRCELFRPQGYCLCQVDDCQSDNDCRAFGDHDAGACTCNSSPLTNLCVDANCRVDADCGPHGYCSPMIDPCSKAISGYFCHTPKDTCTDDADCPGTPCTYLPMASLWRCVRPPQCQ
jgi:hypothetical protein